MGKIIESMCIFQYLQKGAHSLLCLSQNVVLFQESTFLPAAVSHSWTLEAWELEGVSSLQDSESSNMHNETL